MIAPHQQNNVLILRATNDYAWNRAKERHLPSRATKIHSRGVDGKWTTESYNIDSAASATAYSVSCLREFMAVLEKASRDERNYLVGDVVAPGQNPRALRRAIHLDDKGNAPGLTAHPVGHQWFCCEVDKVANPPAWFDPHSKDRSRDAEFVRWWIDTHMPPQFRGRSAVLQWSASGLVGGKISMHIWMWLDRPVARDCIREYYKNRKEWKEIFDTCIWGGARVHYIADPKFRHPDGTHMDDPLAGCRWLFVDGPAGDEAQALPEWVDQPTWAAVQAREADAVAARRAARKSRKAALVASVVASGAAIAAKSKAASKRWTPEQVVAAQDEAAAFAALESCAEQIRNLKKADGKHEALLSITLRAARLCFEVLDEDDVRAALEDDAVDSLMDHERPRPRAVAVNEFRSLLRGAWARAAREGEQGGAPAPDFAGIGAALCAAPTAPLSATPSPISLTGETAAIDVVTMLDIEAENFGIQFIDARAELAHLVAEAVRVGGRHAICAPAGLGKSHAICEALIAHRKTNRLTPDSPVHIAAPDLGLARELRDELRTRGANAVLAVTRTERNCERFAEFILAGKVAPGGGKTLCQSCDLHPKRAGSTDACPFWRAFSEQKKADFICESHALEALKGSMDGAEDSDAPMPVRIDWASFGELDRGDTAVPWVRRTEAGLVVSARACYKVGEGSEAPTPTYETTPRWTAASKTELVEWMAKGLKCDADRASVAEAATGRRTVKAFIDWQDIGGLSTDGALYAVDSYYESKGWLRGWHLTVERASAGEGGRPLPEIEFTGTYPLTPGSKAEIRAWIRGVWGVENDLALDDFARSNINEWPIDALVIDESILHALRFGGSLTRGQITDLRLAGEIGGAGVEALLGLMWKSEENKAAKDKDRPRYFPSDAIAGVVGEAFDVISKHESGAALLQDALRLDDPEQRLARLGEGWGWEAVEALRSCAGAGWAGAYVDGGVLYVAAPRKLALNEVRAVILLDATMTQAQASAALGECAQFEDVRVAQNPFLEVVHIPVDLGPRAGAWGNADGPRTKRSAAHLAAAMCKWGGEDAVTFLHKRAVDPELCWLAPHVLGGEFGAVTYHGAAQSRGSNKYRGLKTCIMTGHHVPRSARRQQAELLARMNGEAFAANPDRWTSEAAWLLEGGAQVQELARIRPLDATANNPKRLIILDTRPPEAFGIRTTCALDPDLLAWDTLAILPPICEAADGSLRLEVMGAVAREAVALAGGVLPVGEVSVEVRTPKRQALEITHMKALSLACQYTDTVGAKEPLSSRLTTWNNTRFASDWRALAAALDLTASPVGLPSRAPLTVLHAGATPPQAALEIHLARLGHYHYHLTPTSPLCAVGGFAEDDKLFQALYPLTRADIAGQSLTTIYRTLAVTADVTPRTISNWITARRLPGEDNRACLARVWGAVKLAVDTERRAEAQRIAQDEYGMTADEAARVVAEHFGAEVFAWDLAPLAESITPEAMASPHPHPLTH